MTPLSTSTNADRKALAAFVTQHPRLVVLTGAGISTGSGIPTYRDEEGNWLRSDPIQHDEFINSASSRQRYWLRSYAGWPAVEQAAPSPAHFAIAGLQSRGICRQIVTQNVDSLHQKAGTQAVVDLHGRLDRVICLECNNYVPRSGIQILLNRLNPFLSQEGTLNPDGDADVDEHDVSRVTVPGCEFCGGILKPDVVFFGGNVDRAIVEAVFNSISEADALLVVGSSLKVFSGYRFCRFAARQGIPIVSINPGITRADPLLTLQIRNTADRVLPDIDALL